MKYFNPVIQSYSFVHMFNYQVQFYTSKLEQEDFLCSEVKTIYNSVKKANLNCVILEYSEMTRLFERTRIYAPERQA
jgi:hypothetical protein